MRPATLAPDRRAVDLRLYLRPVQLPRRLILGGATEFMAGRDR
jgi:hypothetical protein